MTSGLAAVARARAGGISLRIVLLALIGLAVGLGLATGLRESALPVLGITTLALLVALLVRPQAATLLFMLALYLNVPVIAATFYGVPPLLAATFVGLLGVPFAGYLIRGAPIRVAPAMPFLLGLLAAAFISSIFAPDLGVALTWIGVYASEGLLLVFLIANVIRTRLVLVRVLWVLVIAGGLMGALSVYQDATGTYDSTYGGFAQVAGRGFTVDEDPLGDEVRQRRVSGPLGEQNRYAQIMLVLLPMAVALIRMNAAPLPRLVAASAGLLILVGTLLTYSRGAAVALVAMVVMAVVWRFFSWRRVVAVALAMTVVAVILAPAYTARVASLQELAALIEGDSGDVGGALEGRAALNLAAWRAFVEHPLIGVGPDIFATQVSAQYATETGITHFRSSSQYPSHNLYLEVAADLGLLGFTMFMGAIIVTMLGLWRARAASLAGHDGILATALLLSLVGYLVSGIFLHMSYERYFFTLFGIANAAILVLSTRAGEWERLAPERAAGG